MKDILLPDLEDHTNEGVQSLQEYPIVLDIIALITTVLNKSSTYAEFAELLVKRIPNVYRRVDIMVYCYKTKSIKSSEQLSIRRGQSEKIHIASFLSKVPSDFHNSILINSNTKANEFFNSYFNILKKAKHCLELLGSSEIILSSKNKFILVNATERHEL